MPSLMPKAFDRRVNQDIWQLVTLDKRALTDRVGKVSKAKLNLVLDGINTVFGR